MLLSGHVFGPSIHAGTLHFGNRVYVNKQCWFDPGPSSITVEDHVVVAARVSFQGAGHEIGNSSRRATGSNSLPIRVCTGAWIGYGAIILPGVTIARGCIIGAGAVVTSDTEPDGIYAGILARRISDLTPS